MINTKVRIVTPGEAFSFDGVSSVLIENNTPTYHGGAGHRILTFLKQSGQSVSVYLGSDATVVVDRTHVAD